jgi:hypothetical protein
LRVDESLSVRILNTLPEPIVAFVIPDLPRDGTALHGRLAVPTYSQLLVDDWIGHRLDALRLSLRRLLDKLIR